MSSPNPLSNSNAIRADKVEVWNPLKRKYEAVGESIVGLAPDDLNSIELLAQAIDNDPNYFQTVAAGLTAKADRAEVDADLSLLTDLVNTKASSSSVAAADSALQAQVDTKASADALAALSSTVQTKQDALLQVPADAETQELLTGAFLKGVYGVAPVQISTNANILDPTDAKVGHIRVRLDEAFQDSLARKAETDASLAALSTIVETKASQAQLDFVGQNFQPRIAAFEPLSLVPRTDAQDNPFAELSVDLSAYATTAALSNKADQSSLDALGGLVSTLQPAFTALAPLQLDGNVLKLSGSLPLGKFRLRAETDGVFLERYDDDGGLVTDSWQTVAIFGWNPDTNAPGLAVQSLSLAGEDLAVLLEQLEQQIATIELTPGPQGEQGPAGPQGPPGPGSELTPGSSLVFHEPLLQGTKIKSLAPGAGVELSSTEDLVTISAAPVSAPGGTGTFSLVDANGQILRVQPGSGAYASNQSGAVELGVVTQGAQFQAPFSILDQVDGTALRARFAETRAEFFTDTSVNGGLSVTGLSQFAGVEASGVVAEQVVWVTGGGAAQSVMFPGSLQLGKWRLRGSEAGEFYLERFDDDGELQTDAWYPVSTWGFNTQINSPGMGIDNLGVTYNFSAGNITATGSTALQAVSATSIRGTNLLLGPDELGIGAAAGLAAWVDGKLRATDNIETAAGLRTDTVAPFFQGAVRVASGLVVEGPLTVEGTDVLSELGGKQGQLSQAGFGTELLYESSKLKRLQFGAGLVGGTDQQPDGTQNVSIAVSPNLSVESLTVGGVDVAGALAASEPAFTAVAPLRKVVNLQTGELELRVDELGTGGNPIFCGGRVNGAAASPLSSVGRVGYSVSRPSGQGTGVWTITFDSPAPNNDYAVSLSVMLFGAVYMWDQLPPTVNGFTVVVVNNAWQLRNATFHFTILA